MLDEAPPREPNSADWELASKLSACTAGEVEADDADCADAAGALGAAAANSDWSEEPAAISETFTRSNIGPAPRSLEWHPSHPGADPVRDRGGPRPSARR